MAEARPISFRLPDELQEALRKRAEQREESVSDVMRRAVLRELGICPTCGREWHG